MVEVLQFVSTLLIVGGPWEGKHIVLGQAYCAGATSVPAKELHGYLSVIMREQLPARDLCHLVTGTCFGLHTQ